MRFLYSLLFSFAFVLLLPYFLIAGLLRGKYLSSAKERFGWIPVSTSAPSIWVHAVSVGELLAAKPLLARMARELPEIPVVVSTTTIAGHSLAKKIYPNSTFYFPFDWSRCIRRVFRRVRPRLILIMETEIWPNLLWEAQQQNIPVILCNGRLSDASFSGYRMFRRLLPRFTECWMQSEEDAKRMKELNGQNVSVMGNIKFDFKAPQLNSELASSIRNWKDSTLLWIAGSTMPTEEEQVLKAFAQLRTKHNLKLLIAPRHPQRFKDVERLMAATDLTYALRTSGTFRDEAVLLLDSIGELAGCYAFADLVFIGGTIVQTGGHNPIEPASFGKPILAGPNYANFRAVFEEFIKKDAIRITKDLYEDAASLLQDEGTRKKMGESAQSIVRKNAGATDFVMNRLRERFYAGNSLEPDQELLVR